MQHLVIIGNGVAGVTTARHVRKQSDMKITIISSETKFFYSRTALMYIYMGHMKFEHTKPYEDWFWSKNQINLINAHVAEVDSDQKKLILVSGDVIPYDKLVIATGSDSNKFGWPGQDLPGVQGLYSYQDLEFLEENTKSIKRAVIVGGGLIGIELAEMLLSRHIPVTFLVREKYFWDVILPEEEAKLVSRHILEHGIDLRLATELKEITAGEDGRVSGVITNEGEMISCQMVGLTVGVHPNIDMVESSKINTGRGILVNEYMETNLPDIYAAGDCAEIIATENNQKNRVEQLWYTGRMQGEALANTICGVKTKHERGIWFNSAKFLDIEYQTYGYVSNKQQPDESSFYWESDDHKQCLRIVYDRNSSKVKGFNVFGIRLRQDVCQNWIKDEKNLDFVLRNLRSANFDPEIFKHFEPDILARYSIIKEKELSEIS